MAYRSLVEVLAGVEHLPRYTAFSSCHHPVSAKTPGRDGVGSMERSQWFAIVIEDMVNPRQGVRADLARQMLLSHPQRFQLEAGMRMRWRTAPVRCHTETLAHSHLGSMNMHAAPVP